MASQNSLELLEISRNYGKMLVFSTLSADTTHKYVNRYNANNRLT